MRSADDIIITQNSSAGDYMNNIFKNIPVIKKETSGRYDCSKGCEMIVFDNCTKSDYEMQCSLLENAGFLLCDEHNIKENYHKTYRKTVTAHIYYCESENKLRLIADPNRTPYCTEPDNRGGMEKTTLWQFEVDHTLIDCGMCYVVRCRDGSFFVIDSAHMYSVNDDIRIIEFLKKLNGGKKPVVAGWFFSHCHEDHVAKFLDIVEYHRNEIDIEAVYYNFPAADHRDAHYWGECNYAMTERFERVVRDASDIKKINLHTGQHFYVRNLEFTVLCTHEDVFPHSMQDFNNSSTVLMMEAEGCKVLFPGDASAESDKVLLRRYGDYLKCEVIQVSHHGHSGTSPEFYRLADAECALFAVTQIKFDEELPRQEANRVAIDLAKEYHIASNGTVEIPLPYIYGQTKIYPDETFEDFNGIYNLWSYEYSDEMKQKLYEEFLERKNR